MTKKIVATILGLSMMVMLFPGVNNAATVEELQAQIAALTAQLAALQTQLTALGATPTTGAPAACAGITFTANLTVGSSGNNVKCLQALLNQSADTQVAATGVGSLGAETIYFGPLTKAAAIKFQEKYATDILTPLGLTAGTGFVGSSTRAKLNALLAGAPTTPTTPTTPTIPGAAEGILTAEVNPSPASGVKLYEGDKDVAVLGILLKAKISDIYIQRLTLNFGTTRPYDYLDYLTLYEDGSAVVGKTLDSTSVYKSGTNYYIQLSGFSVKVAKDGSKILTVKVNAKSAIASYFNLPVNVVATVDISGIRGVDTAGVIQYAPGAYFSRTFSVDSTLAADAAISIARNASSPLPGNIGAGTLGTVYGATLLLFDIKAEYDTVKITSIDDIAFSGTATPTTAYIYDGSTLLSSASVSAGGLADFNGNLSIVVNKDATKTLTIKADYTDLTASKKTSTVTVSAGTNMTAENSIGIVLATGNKTGSAVSYTLDLYTIAPVLSLTSATITKTPASEVASSSADAKIVFTLTAQGGDVTTTLSDAITAGYTTTTYAGVTVTGVSVTYGMDGAVESGTTYTIAKNTTATVTVDVKIRCVTLPVGFQSNFGYVTLTGFTWNTDKTTNHFMDIFKTGKVFLP